MPIPSIIGKVNRRFTHRITSRFAGLIPPFAIVEHRGRRTGTLYHTPVFAFPFSSGFEIALTYGPETDWVRNVMAGDGCFLEYRRQRVALSEPSLHNSMPETAALPFLVRLGLGVLRVPDYLRLQRHTADIE